LTAQNSLNNILNHIQAEHSPLKDFGSQSSLLRSFAWLAPLLDAASSFVWLAPQ
jgi:hypothetical protein